MVLSEGDDYERIRAIVGEANTDDCTQLEGHLRSSNDYFITDDRDFLDKRQELENEFKNKNLRILTLEELQKMFEK